MKKFVAAILSTATIAGVIASSTPPLLRHKPLTDVKAIRQEMSK